MTGAPSGEGASLPLAANLAAIARRLRRPPPAAGAGGRRLAAGTVIAGAVMAVLLIALAVAFLDAASVPWAHRLPQATVAFFARVTRFGQSDWLLIPSGAFTLLLLLADWRRVAAPVRRAWAEAGALVGCFFVAVAVAGLITDLVKWIVGRSRPPLFATDGILAFHPFAAGYLHVSFPSGHSTTVAAVTVVVLLVSRRAAAIVGLAAAMIAFSRVVVGAHYPSDVTAGLLIGASYAYGLARWLSRRRIAFGRDRTGRIRPRIAALRRISARGGGWRTMLAALPAALRLAPPPG